jgi:VanZ family protein
VQFLSPDRRALVWPFIVAGLIFLASSRSHLAGPSIDGSDKVVHFLVYGLLATLVVRNGQGWRAAVYSILAVSLYGVSDEWHQSFTPGRSVEVADWAADTLGATLAVLLYTCVPRYRACLESPIGGRKPRIEKPLSVETLSTP